MIFAALMAKRVELVETAYDLLLLDVMLPQLNEPWEALSSGCDREVIVFPLSPLRLRDTSTDKVMGLDAGADSYINQAQSAGFAGSVRALLRRGIQPCRLWQVAKPCAPTLVPVSNL